MVIREILISSIILTAPGLSAIIFLTKPEIFSKIFVFTPINLNPSSIFKGIGNIIANPIISIWNWLLYNLISPLLIIVFLILFFVGQYYLIKLYIYLIKNLILNILKAYNYILKSEFVKKLISLGE